MYECRQADRRLVGMQEVFISECVGFAPEDEAIVSASASTRLAMPTVPHSPNLDLGPAVLTWDLELGSPKFQVPSQHGRSKVQGPRSKVQGPRSKVQGPRSKVQGPRSKVQGPRSKVQGPRSKVQGPRSKVQGPRSKVQGPRSKVQGPRSKVQGPRSKVQGPRSKVQGPRSKVQGPRSKVQGPRSKVQGPRFKVSGNRIKKKRCSTSALRPHSYIIHRNSYIIAPPNISRNESSSEYRISGFYRPLLGLQGSQFQSKKLKVSSQSQSKSWGGLTWNSLLETETLTQTVFMLWLGLGLTRTLFSVKL
jgi:hypothetical protein